ncbi:MAG: peptidyl-prolyl cis-trans isomerase cyclophilin type [Chthoniobacteraceae bacterium]|nr:peptidyl-prolyl cis-trans isomerase cyclophilin type [Chthoniobacteraceae bacterium]
MRRHPWSLLLSLLAVVLLNAVPALANVAPEFIPRASVPTFRVGGTAQDLDLRTLFRDPDVLGSAVRVSVRLGATIKTFDIALFDQEKPITVTNFLAYLNAGRFNSNFFHRSVAGFVVQGGGFAWSSENNVVSVPTFEKIKNEPGISNLRGTVAMAKLGGDPDSATSQWFVNLADNSGNLDAQNGGFTVFGRVVGTGMTLVDEIAALPVYNAGSPFDSLPLKGYTSGSNTRVYTVETNTALIPTLSFSAVSNNPSLVGVSMTGTTLRLTPGASSGTTTITLSATDLDGATKEATLTINVLAQSAGWHAEKGPDGEFNLFSLDRADSSPLAENPVSVHWGPVFLNTPSTRTFTVTNKGPAALASFSITRSNPDDFAITSGAGPSTVAGGASTTFTVVFTPSAIGPRSALLHLASTDPNEASLDIAVSGTGTSPDDVIPPTLSPASPQTLIADARRLAQIPDWRGTAVTATDNKEVVSFTQTPLPGSFQPIGDYSLVFSATDAAGNTSSTQSTLKVLYDPATMPQLSLSAALGGAGVPAEGNTDLPAGSFLSAFGTPAISDIGSLAARVTITAGKARLAGIYWENEAGENKIVARQNQPSSGTNFKSFRDPVLAPGGATAFAATLNGRKANEDEGLWTNLFGSLAPVLREGEEIPGLGGLKLKSVTSVSLEDDALLALVKLLPMPGLVTSANDTALVRITGLQAGRLLARTGAAFDGSLIKQISVFQPAARSPGQGRWSSGSDIVAKLTLADRRTVVATLHSDGTRAALLQTRSASQGSGLASLSLPALGGSSVAVLATKAIAPGITAANDAALYFAPNGTEFTDVIREEPGVGKFASFSDPVVNTQGEMLFFGTRRGDVARSPSVNALWQINHLSALQLVAQIGGSAVDKEGTPLADTVWSAFTSFALPDGSGPVFVAQLSGRAVTGQKKLGLWAADSAGKVRQLLRTGDDVPVPAGPKRLTGFTILNALPGSFGVRRSYNATGALALQATFADHSQAILRVNVP